MSVANARALNRDPIVWIAHRAPDYFGRRFNSNVASDMRLTAGVEHHLRGGRAVIGEEPGVDSSGGELVDIAPVNLGWPDAVPAMKDQYRGAGRVARGFDHRDRVGAGRSFVGSGH